MRLPEPYEWFSPFDALEAAEYYASRDHDYAREVDEMRHRMRERYGSENAMLRAQHEAMMKLISQMAPMFPLIVPKADGLVVPQAAASGHHPEEE